jgi:hypothetical protein
MPANVEDLWPAEVSEVKKLTVPASIAMEQAALLGQKTNNVVTATVTPVRTREPWQVVFGFNLVAPALSNYRLRVFNFTYRLDQLYPVTAYSFGVRGFEEPMEAADERAWKDLLKRIFSHENVVLTIRALLAQSEDIGPQSEDVPF